MTRGAWFANAHSRRDNRTADQLDALRKPGIDQAQQSVAHLPEIARERHLGTTRKRLSRASDGTSARLRSQQRRSRTATSGKSSTRPPETSPYRA
ncbi:hypothetical protein [Streptomyces erythrochromogenes]|uniref:hypothetical protein n=1 Tax=Streptomyces erythrochromogenes TaxID=285574 RepID=UPI00386C32D0|nr:hypothetical protein OG364_02755 [Streptomyces erythrochromogenes]